MAAHIAITTAKRESQCTVASRHTHQQAAHACTGRMQHACIRAAYREQEQKKAAKDTAKETAADKYDTHKRTSQRNTDTGCVQLVDRLVRVTMVTFASGGGGRGRRRLAPRVCRVHIVSESRHGAQLQH